MVRLSCFEAGSVFWIPAGYIVAVKSNRSRVIGTRRALILVDDRSRMVALRAAKVADNAPASVLLSIDFLFVARHR